MGISENLISISNGLERLDNINDNLEKILYSTDTGGKSYYDEFWDAYQNNGVPHMYHYKFAGTMWTETTFRPKYDLKPRYGSTYTFALCYVKDLVASLKAQGRVLDTKEATDMRYFCYSMQSKTFPTLDFSGIVAADLTKQANIFNNAQKLETIEKIILQDGLTFSSWFTSCKALKNVTFEGNIGNDISFKDSPLLSRESIESIINHLSDTTSGKTLTLSKTAVENDFNTPIEILPFKDSPSSVFTNRGDGSIMLNEIPSENTTYTFKDDLVLPKGSYRVLWTEGHCDWDYMNVFLTLRVNGEIASGCDRISPSYGGFEYFTFNITDDEGVVSLSATACTGLGWSGEPLEITPFIYPGDRGWYNLVENKPNWTISLV